MAAALLAWGTLLAGCGQKGPLVLPKPTTAAAAKPAASAAAPATAPPASR